MKKSKQPKLKMGLSSTPSRITAPAGKSVSPVSHEVSVKIVSALNNKQYKARTIGGIAQETGLPKTVVVEAIRSNGELVKAVKISPIRSSGGKVLITTKERFGNEASLKEKFIDFFSTLRIGVVDAE